MSERDDRVEVLDRLVAALDAVFKPSGWLIFVSMPNRVIGGATVADAIRRHDLDALKRVCDHLDTLAGGPPAHRHEGGSDE